MTPELVLALISGQGSALVILLLWIRSITKDRDFWREAALGDRFLAKVAVEELESRPKPPPGRPGLSVVNGN